MLNIVKCKITFVVINLCLIAGALIKNARDIIVEVTEVSPIVLVHCK